MPIYEYQCTQCHGHFQRLVRGFSDPADLACPRCQSAQVTRQMSRVAQIRSESSHADRLMADGTLAHVDENDPRAVAQWAKKLGHTIGADAGTDWNEMVDQMVDEEFSGNDANPSSADDLGWA